MKGVFLLTRKSSSRNKEEAVKRRKEKCQNAVKIFHEDPTGCAAIKNIMRSKHNININ